jgi:hypothetical protein
MVTATNNHQLRTLSLLEENYKNRNGHQHFIQENKNNIKQVRIAFMAGARTKFQEN